MRGIVTKLAVLTFLMFAIAGCGADVNAYFGGGFGEHGVFANGQDTGYYEYDPFWYDPYDDIYYDDPYYWDDAYWEDDGYYGDDWYWEDDYYEEGY